MSEKRTLNANETKSEFVKSIHNWLLDTLDRVGNGAYKSCFKIEGSSIICDLPPEYFTHFNIPANTKIEMKFITKRN